ncbi:hypothetical protein [Nonomuraea ceibae]|nr:hypothetical protein [Nonomuraea ceibae]
MTPEQHILDFVANAVDELSHDRDYLTALAGCDVPGYTGCDPDTRQGTMR